MKFEVVKVDRFHYMVAAMNGNSDLMAIEVATSLAAELNAREAKLAEVEGKYEKLRAACASAEMSIMETSGEWRLYDTSERGKELDLQTLDIANKNCDLEIEIKSLTAERDRLRAYAEAEEAMDSNELDWANEYDHEGYWRILEKHGFDRSKWKDSSDWLRELRTTALSAKGEQPPSLTPATGGEG